MSNGAKNQKRVTVIIFFLLLFILAGLIFIVFNNLRNNSNSVSTDTVNAKATSTLGVVTTSSTNVVDKPTVDSNALFEPISGALSRITKKPFGIKVSPGHSPISPERFSGYHTGVDFETTAQEQNIDVPIYAICSGPLVLKKYATGYGGVAVQSCDINKLAVTVVYGHLRLNSINIKSGQQLQSGEQIGVLGRGYSTETAGERKHLHLGIHLGSAIDLLGYVQSTKELTGWLDFTQVFK